MNNLPEPTGAAIDEPISGRIQPGRYYGRSIPYLPINGYPGKLIAVEGTDSVGRTTQIQLLREWLEVFSDATTRPALSNTGTASATTPMASSSSTSA